jgi:hypothetical protein
LSKLKEKAINKSFNLIFHQKRLQIDAQTSKKNNEINLERFFVSNVRLKTNTLLNIEKVTNIYKIN